MSPQRIRLIALAAILLVLLAALFAWQKTVIVLADGAAYTVTTRALTVRGAVEAAGLMIGPEDQLVPGGWTWLRNDLIIDLRRAANVSLQADGQSYQFVSNQRNPEALLDDLGLELSEDDRLLLAGQLVNLEEDLPTHQNLVLELRRAVSLDVEDDGQRRQFNSSAATVGEALAEAGYELQAADRLEPAADTPLDSPVEVVITRARPIQIEVGGQDYALRSAAATVGEALAEAGIALQGLDIAEPAEGQAVPEDGLIRVRRIYEQVEIEQAFIDYTIEWVADPETEFGQTSVIELGQRGVIADRTRIRYEDGEEIERIEDGQWTLVEPKTQISGYGSQIVARTAVVDGVEIEYWATLEMYATSYSPCRSGVDECLYGTSTPGVLVDHGVVATYRDWYLAARGIPLYIPGYGSAQFYDVGGGFPDGRAWIDLGYTDEEWVGWSQWVTVYFLTPVPASIPYFLQP